MNIEEDVLRDARILIVDDHEDNVAYLEALLSTAGTGHLASTTDSTQALPLFEQFAPDLVVLDLMMPGLDGFEIMERLAPLISPGSYLPILVLTANVTPQVKRRALRAGAGDFLTKPFDATEAVLRIRNLLRMRALHEQLRRQNLLLDEQVRARTRELDAALLRAREGEASLQALMDAVAEGIITFDDRGLVTSFNRAAAEMFGYSPEDVRGRPLTLLFPTGYQREQGAHALDSMIGEREGAMDGQERRLELVGLRASGGAFPADLVIRTTRLPERRFSTAVIHDVTERKWAEAELIQEAAVQRDAAERLRELDRSRGEFISILAGEFRTPLAILQGFGELLRDDALSRQEIREYAADVNRQALRLSRLLSDMLDFDALLSGRLAPGITPIGLNAVVREAVDLARRDALGHLFTLRLDESLVSVPGDRQLLAQVMDNLLSNALKYSPPGTEIVVASSLAEGNAHVSVADQGPGIPAESLEKIFLRRSAFDLADRRYVKGTGLGLPLVRKIVDLHGGRVWAESAPGRGAVFHFTLPLGTALSSSLASPGGRVPGTTVPLPGDL